MFAENFSIGIAEVLAGCCKFFFALFSQMVDRASALFLLFHKSLFLEFFQRWVDGSCSWLGSSSLLEFFRDFLAVQRLF